MTGPARLSDISVFTTKDAREVIRSHVNLFVNDTSTWEQSAACHLDSHNAIPYFYETSTANMCPICDSAERMGRTVSDRRTKGADWERTRRTSRRKPHVAWCAAVNATGEFGTWDCKLAFSVPELVQHLNGVSPK